MNSQKIKTCLNDDTTTYKEHNIFTHLGCVLLRIILGLLVITDTFNLSVQKNKIIFMVLIMILIFLFTVKYINLVSNGKLVWKVYLRMIIAYTCNVILIKQNYFKEAGMLMIIDALMGLQSRQISYNLLQCRNI